MSSTSVTRPAVPLLRLPEVAQETSTATTRSTTTRSHAALCSTDLVYGSSTVLLSKAGSARTPNIEWVFMRCQALMKCWCMNLRLCGMRSFAGHLGTCKAHGLEMHVNAKRSIGVKAKAPNSKAHNGRHSSFDTFPAAGTVL